MIYVTATHPHTRTITRLISNKVFIKTILHSIVMSIQILTNTISFLHPFFARREKILIKMEIQIFKNSKKFSSLLSQIVLPVMFAPNNKCLCPYIRRLHFFLFSFSFGVFFQKIFEKVKKNLKAFSFILLKKLF